METARPRAVGVRSEGAPAPSVPLVFGAGRAGSISSCTIQSPQKKKRASATLGEAAADKAAASHERFLEAFRWMLLARTLEEKLISLYRGGQITGGVYIGKGQEAVSVACGLLLEKGDIFAPLIRDQAGRSAFGEPLVD